MSRLQHRVGPVSARRRSVLVRAREEAGDTMIEVMVAALIVALIAGAVFTALSAVAHIQGAQRHQSVATQLAQQDEQRLRGLTVQQLIASTSGSCLSTAPLVGNGCYTQTLDGETYTITSTAKFYSASNGSLSCTTSGAPGNADYIATTSDVSWLNSNDNRHPVESHSLITPSSGGQIVVAAQDSAGSSTTGVAGATVTITGPDTSTATQSQTTDANGCALFVAVTAGSYSVSATFPSPYVAYGGTTTQSLIVVNNQTQTATFTVAQAATVNAGFTTAVNGGAATAIPFDTFSFEPTSESTATSFGTVGSNATPPATVSTGATVYPYTSGYTAYAGNCTADDPGASNGSAVSVTEGGTTATTVKLPSMLLALSTQIPSSGGTAEYNEVNPSGNAPFENNAPDSSLSWSPNGSTTITYVGSWNHSSVSGDYNSDETWSSTTGSYVTVTFTGTSIEWISSFFNNHGNATVTLFHGTGIGGSVAQAAAPFSDYSSNTQFQQGLYSSGPLTSGTYTLEIAVTGTEPAGSSGTNVSADAFIVGTGPTTEINQSNGAALTYTSGTTTITYSSGWTYAGPNYTSGSAPGDGGSAGDYGQDEAYSNNAGNSVSVTFTGTSIEWLAKLYSNHGNATVTLHNGTGTGGTVVQTGSYSNYDPDTEYQDAPYSSGPLAYGTYTVVITVPSGGTYVTTDGFIVVGGSGATTTPVTSWPSGWTLKTYDSCPTPVARALPSNPVATTVSSQTVFPVAAPYGASVQVCVANGTTSSTGVLPSSPELSNTDFTGRTIQSLTLPTTSGSGSSAVFANSGGCP